MALRLSTSLPLRALSRLARTSPVILGSVLLHAGAAMALVATGSGHARSDAPMQVSLVDVDTIPIEVPPPAPEPTLPNVVNDAPPQRPTHTHDYPVPPDHDAHPHDPSLKHEMALPAQAAPALTSDEPAALPHFDIPSGAGLPVAHGQVTSNPAAVTTSAGAGHDDDDVIVPASGVHVAAKLVSSVVATYPTGARSDDVEGDVGLEIVLDRDGHVVDARVVRQAGHGFDEAALSAIRRYRFSPAQRGGHSVRVRMPWSVQFRLR